MYTHKRNPCTIPRVVKKRRKVTEIFLQLFTEKNSDGTKNIRLKGKDMWQRFERRIDYLDMGFISDYLYYNRQIVKLDLCYNDIGDEGLRELVDGYLIYKENNLKHLNIMSCDITVVGMEHMLRAVDTLKLEVLRLTGNKLGYDGSVVTARLVGSMNTLQYLDLGDTDQSLGTVQFFMEAIREDITTHNTIKVLDFSRVLPMSKGVWMDSTHLAQAIGLMLKVNSVLIELHLQKNQFDGHNMEYLLYGLEFNNTLLLLDLGNNNIGNHGMELLSKWLKKRPPLLGLNVTGNNIGDLGARFSSSDAIDITFNYIGDIGMIDILHTIKKPVMMRVFFFWGNKIAQPTFAILQRMMLSEVFVQEQIDLKLYIVDEVLYAAYYPANHHKHRYYCVMDHGCPIELRIKRNKIESEYAQPRLLTKFENYDRCPLVDEALPLKPTICETYKNKLPKVYPHVYPKPMTKPFYGSGV